MKIALVVGLFAIGVATAHLTSTSDAEQEWTLFKSKYNKVYGHQKEEVFRRNVYFENKMKMIENNKLYEKGKVTYEMGINKFSDLTDNEVVETNKCLKSSSSLSTQMLGSSFNYYSVSDRGRAPPAVDWRKKNCVTHVKQQGNCKACWAFSAVDVLESLYCIQYGKLVSLSEQILVDCSKEGGCSGGWMNEAFQWIIDNGGIASAEDYPYESADGWERTCLNDTEPVLEVKDYTFIPSGDESALLDAVVNVGPISVAVKSDANFFRYSSGVYNSSSCGDHTHLKELNVGLVAVGYGTDSEGEDFWILKSSLGEEWGDGGYIKMPRNRDNHCGVASNAVFPVLGENY